MVLDLDGPLAVADRHGTYLRYRGCVQGGPVRPARPGPAASGCLTVPAVTGRWSGRPVPAQVRLAHDQAVAGASGVGTQHAVGTRFQDAVECGAFDPDVVVEVLQVPQVPQRGPGVRAGLRCAVQGQVDAPGV